MIRTCRIGWERWGVRGNRMQGSVPFALSNCANHASRPVEERGSHAIHHSHAGVRCERAADGIDGVRGGRRYVLHRRLIPPVTHRAAQETLGVESAL